MEMDKKMYVEANSQILNTINDFERRLIAGEFYVSRADLNKLCRMRAVVIKLCNEASEGIFQDLDYCSDLKNEIMGHVNSLIR